jgi:hypothetical protein
MNKKLEEYLNIPAGDKRANLKKQYLSNRFGASELERALDHLNFLVEFTRRLNMVECKDGSQPIPKPSALRKTDLLVCVEICAESIQENGFLQTNAEFRQCWIAFEELLNRIATKNGSDEFFEASFLLLYLAALIFKRHIADGEVEKEPQIFSIDGYKAVAVRFAHPIFQSVKSSSEQLTNLAANLKNLARV